MYKFLTTLETTLYLDGSFAVFNGFAEILEVSNKRREQNLYSAAFKSEQSDDIQKVPTKNGEGQYRSCGIGS
jgi:hypothetical protein